MTFLLMIIGTILLLALCMAAYHNALLHKVGLPVVICLFGIWVWYPTSVYKKTMIEKGTISSVALNSYHLLVVTTNKREFATTINAAPSAFGNIKPKEDIQVIVTYDMYHTERNIQVQKLNGQVLFEK